MYSTARQHIGAGLVAAGMVAAALAEGLFEPTGYAAASIVIWAAVIAGIVGRGLPAAPIARPAAVAGICLGATAALTALSIGWASNQGAAFEAAVRVSFYLGLFALAACTASRAGISQWLAGLTVGAAAVSVLGVLAYLQPGLLTQAGNEVTSAAGRLSYPLGYWNAMAALFAVAMILLAHGGIAAPTRGLRSASISVFPLVVLGLWLTDSRGGAVAAIIGLAILLAASPDRPRQLVVLLVAIAGGAVLVAVGAGMDALRNGLGDSAMRADGDRLSVAVVAVIGLVGAGAWGLDGRSVRLSLSRPARLAVIAAVAIGVVVGVIAARPIDRFRDFEKTPTSAEAATAADLSSNGRWQFWTAAVDAFDSAPAAGVGAGGYEDYWARHADVPIFVRNAHSLPLQQAAELGGLGVALFLAFLAAVAVGGWAKLRQGRAAGAGVLVAVVAAAAVGAAIDWTWEIPAAFAPAVVCAGLLTASAPLPRIRRDGYWLGAATVAIAWVAMVGGGLLVLSELELQRSRDAAANGEIAAGMDRAQDAHTVTPWSSEPYLQMALLQEQGGDLDRALGYLRQAESRDSEDWRLPLIESRLLASKGNVVASLLAVRRAQELGPQYLGPLHAQG